MNFKKTDTHIIPSKIFMNTNVHKQELDNTKNLNDSTKKKDYKLEFDDYKLLQNYCNLNITALQDIECKKEHKDSPLNKKSYSIKSSQESKISVNECLKQLAETQYIPTTTKIISNSLADMEKKHKFSLSLKRKINLETSDKIGPEVLNSISATKKNFVSECTANKFDNVSAINLNQKLMLDEILEECTSCNENNDHIASTVDIKKECSNLIKNEEIISNNEVIPKGSKFEENEVKIISDTSFEVDMADDDDLFGTEISQYENYYKISEVPHLNVSDKNVCDTLPEKYLNDIHVKKQIEKTENDNNIPKKIITSTQISNSEMNKVSSPSNVSFIPPPAPMILKSNRISNIMDSLNEVSMNESNKNWSQTYEIDLLNSHNSNLLENLSKKINNKEFKENIELSFIQCENLIHEIAPGQDNSLRKLDLIINKSNTSNETINKSEYNISYELSSGIEWTHMMLSKHSDKEQNKQIGMGDKIKNMLLNNAQNLITSQTSELSYIMSSDISFNDLGPFYGLPLKVKELISQLKGIKQLYDWQDECLKLDAIKSRNNLIYALPTSGGKTLVAEILLFREILCKNKNVLFILPYVSIVQEKVWSLSPFAVALDFLIEQYAANKGTYPPRKRRRKNAVYIATIEKALGLVNSLLEDGRLGEIGLIIVDELHLIGEANRGSLLETVLIKILHSREDIQIIGMSATIGNLKDLSKFLHAEMYTHDFRPVELQEFIKCGDQIASINLNFKSNDELFVPARKVNYGYPEFIEKIDPDHIGGLVMEVVPDASCLIFCPSKQNCENVALLLSKVLFRRLLEHRKDEKNSILASMESEGKVCSVLAKTIPFGIAYHHSGLTVEERKVIEDGFRNGVLSVICCTSTLAAGVNLPAKRVILRSPYIARDFITLARYKQMVGRAGRAGLGEIGESIVLCAKQDIPCMRKLLTSPMDNVVSQMNKMDSLKLLILSCVNLNIATTEISLKNIMTMSLLSIQKDYLNIDINILVHESIIDLIKLKALSIKQTNTKSSTTKQLLIEVGKSKSIKYKTNENEISEIINEHKILPHTEFEVSNLGKAAIKGNMDIQRAQLLHEDLVLAQASLVLLDPLHLLYLVTPYDLAEQVKPTLNIYYTVFMELGTNELQTAKVIGITESCAIRMMTGQRITNVPERVLNRFYLTLILYELWNQKPLFDIAEKYKVNRGIVQQLMIGASSFASNVVRFCEEFEEFWAFSHLLKDISARLAYCCTPELLPLMDLPAVKKARAKQLYQAGYKTLQSIAKANPNDLVNLIKFMNRTTANQLIASAKLLLLEKVESLREEVEDVLEGLESNDK